MNVLRELDLALAVQAFVTLTVIMDPLGNVPVFLGLTRGEDRAARRRIARSAMLAAAGIVYLFAVFGTQILAGLSIGLPALQVAGGVVLFLAALAMLRGEDLMPDRAEGVNVAIVPLGVPLVAGLATVRRVVVAGAAVRAAFAGDVRVRRPPPCQAVLRHPGAPGNP